MKAWQFAAGDSLDFWISCCLSSFQSSQMRHGKLTCRKRSRSPRNLGPTENCRHRLQPAMKAMAEMVVALPGSRSSVECSHRRLPRWSSSHLLCPAQTWRVQLMISGRPFSMLPTLVQVRLGHNNSIADVAYAGFLRPFVSREGSSLKKIYVGGSGFGNGAAEALAHKSSRAWRVADMQTRLAQIQEWLHS